MKSEKATLGPKRVSGIVTVTRSGKGFLIQEKGDVPIPRERLNGALSCDVVEVALTRGRYEMIGTVLRVIERKTNTFVGIVIPRERWPYGPP